MRNLIGYLVARDGAEAAVARVAGGIFPTDNSQTGSVRAGSPITIVYSGENFARGAITEIACAIPGFGAFDCSIRAGQAAGEGARRT